MHFPLRANQLSLMHQGVQQRDPPNWTILVSWVLDSFTLADEPFAKVLRSLEISVSVNNNLWQKFVSSVEFPIAFAERFS